MRRMGSARNNPMNYEKHLIDSWGMDGFGDVSGLERRSHGEGWPLFGLHFVCLVHYPNMSTH